MELANYKACICEGSAENAIMDILLDYNLLIFNIIGLNRGAKSSMIKTILHFLC